MFLPLSSPRGSGLIFLIYSSENLNPGSSEVNLLGDSPLIKLNSEDLDTFGPQKIRVPPT